MLVPPWKTESPALLRRYTDRLSACGYDVWMVVPPEHMSRSSPGARSGHGFATLDLERFRALFEQLVVEIRAALAMARLRGPAGLVAVSVGGLAASFALTSPEAPDFAALVAPPADLARVLLETAIGGRYRRLAERAGSRWPDAAELRRVRRTLATVREAPVTRAARVQVRRFRVPVTRPSAPRHRAVLSCRRVLRSIAHVSDLHFGRDRRTEAAARALASALVDAEVGAVLVTGDVTHRGRAAEMRAFEDAFAPLLERGRVVVVPGNHDRAGEDVGATLMIGSRVGVADLPGLHVVRVNSTAPHNRSIVAAHGLLDEGDLREVDAALREAPAGAVSVVMLHHHVLPLPADDLVERLSGWLGWPHAEELPRGRELVRVALGRCDLVLHGHRHVAGEAAIFPGGARPLAVVNAGCTPDLGGARVFFHEHGALRGSAWISASAGRGRARRSHEAA